MSCLDDDTVLRFVQRRLGQVDASRVDTHIAACSECRVLVAEAAKYMLDDRGGPVQMARGHVRSLVLQGGAAPLPAEQAALEAGEMVHRYRIVEAIGRGAMGVVYAAIDPNLRRRIALKVLRSDRARSKSADSRLLREARAMARVSHPNVVTVHDTGAFRGGIFVAMELVEGQTLRAWCAERSRSYGEVLDVFEAAGRGLAAAHAAGLVHRDFKPDNVLLGTDGRVRVTDFGLARAAISDLSEDTAGRALPHGLTGESQNELTRPGAVIGTPAYMAPEQLLSMPTDARTDQFSFCVALYEALYGVRPFAVVSVPELIGAVLHGRVEPPPPDSLVPAGVGDVIVRGLRAHAEDRHASMEALLDALAIAKRSNAEPVAKVAPAPRRRGPVVVATSALAMVGVAAVVLVGSRSTGMAPPGEGRLSGEVETAIAEPTAHAASLDSATAEPPVSSARAEQPEADPPPGAPSLPATATAREASTARVAAPATARDRIPMGSRSAPSAVSPRTPAPLPDTDAPITDPWKR